MTRTPDPQWGAGERRNARIRELRDQREGPIRRRHTFQPAVLIAWFAGVIALAGVLFFLGFLAFAPGLMTWIEENPGSIEHGVVQDFVEWYRPGVLDDVPASEDGPRVTVTVEPGSNATEIGQLLFEEGVITSRLAFHFAVLEADRASTLAAGTYDLSPSLRPSQIVAALRQVPGEEVEVVIREGWRLEEIVGYLGTTDLTMNLEDSPRWRRRRRSTSSGTTTSWPTCRSGAAWRASSTPTPTGWTPTHRPGRWWSDCSTPSGSG